LNFSNGWIVERDGVGGLNWLSGVSIKVKFIFSVFPLSSSARYISKPTSPRRHETCSETQTSCYQTTLCTTTMAPSLEEPQESGTNQLIAPEPEHCPGPESQQAGQGDACQTCPNKEICASAPKGPDLDIPAITERLRDVKHKILVSPIFSPFCGSQS
jgi:hypothetical protein